MIGTLVGNYRIVEKLGDGGMGAVYRAVDELLDREVAVKVLRSELAGKASLIERFRAEAIALARLNHPRIATLHGLERNGVDFVMIMEYVRGETLEQVVARSGKVSWVRAVEICIDICDALDHAHDRGVVHRDIKPANVMLSSTGLIKVMDFGIARVVGRDRQTQFGHSVGTPMYMAPEQLRAEEVDGRADIYALGAVLFELITGRMAFEADSDYSLMMKQLHEAPPRPSSVVREVPDAVDRIVLSAMAKSRDDRLASAAVMRAALRDALRAGPRTDLPPQVRAMAKDIAPPATRIGVDAPAVAAAAAHADAVPETRFAPAPSPAGVPETRFGDAPPRYANTVPATRIAFESGAPQSAAPVNKSWMSRELSRWRSDRVRWIGAALVVVAAGASTAKFLSASPETSKPGKSGGTVVAVIPDTSHAPQALGGGTPEAPRGQVTLPKVGSLQEVGATTPTPPPAAGGGAKPVDAGQTPKPNPKARRGGADTPSTPAAPPKQSPPETVVPAPAPPPTATATSATTAAARFHAAGNKQIDAFLQLIRDRDVTTVERLLLASNTNRSVHQQLIAIMRAGRVEVSAIDITSLTRNDNGGAAQFDATLNFRSPFGANRKSPAQFALELGGESEGWVVKSARIIGSPKFK